MKKNVRLVLLLALIAVMIVMTAVFASAADVATADEFKAAVAAGGEVNLTGDITLSEGITIDKNVTIKGNGRTIEFTAGTKLETYVSLASNAARRIESYGFNFVGGTVKLQNVTVKAPADKTADVGARIGIFLLNSEYADVILEDLKTDGGYIPIVFAAPSKLTMNDTSNDHTNTVIGTNMGYQYVMGSSTVAYVDGKVPTFVQNGGTFTAQTAAVKSDMMRFESGMNFTVNDGIWDGFGNLYYSVGNADYGNTVITINGGEFYSDACIFNPAGSYDLYVYGGGFYSEGGCFNLRSTKEGAACVFENATLNTGDSGGCILVGADKPYNISIKNCNLYGYGGVRFRANITEALTLTIDGCTFRSSYDATSDPTAADDDKDACTGAMIVRYDSSVKITNSTVTIKNCDIDTTKYWNGGDVTSANYVFQNSYGTFIVENNTVVHGGKYAILQMNTASTWIVNGGSYTHTGSGNVFYVSDGSVNITINGGTYTNNGTGVLLQKNNGKIAIKNATLIQNAEGKDLIVTTAGRNGYITIEKSTLTHSAGGNVLNVAAATSGAALITFNNVACTGVIAVAEVAEGNVKPSLTLLDSTFTTLTDPSSVAVVTTTNQPYFTIDGETNVSWADALAGVAAGGTITVVGPVDWALIIETDKIFTLDAGEYTLPGLELRSGNVTLVNVKLSTSTSAAALTVGENATVTLSTGCEFTATGSGSAVVNNGTLVINGATVTTTGSTYSVYCSGNTTIESGNINGTVFVNKGALTINNGTFRASGTYAHHRGRSPLILSNNSQSLITINGGDFEKTNNEDGTASDESVAPDALLASVDANNVWIINGGTFKALGEYGYVANFYSTDYIAINGGTFISENSDYAVIRIVSLGAGTMEKGAPIVLSGFTVEGGCTGLELVSGSVHTYEISDVTITSAKYAIHLQNGSRKASVVIKNGTFTSEGEAVVQASGANLVIEGGSFVAKNEAVVLNLSDNDVVSNVTIKGGTFRADGTGAVISIAHNNYNAINYPEAGSASAFKAGSNCLMGDLVIEGGTFTAMNAHVLNHTSIKTQASVDVTIKGGSFTSGSDAVVYIAASNPATKIVLGGKLNLVGATADAAIVKLGAETLNYRKNGESKTYEYAAGCQVILDGAVLVCRNATATALVDNTAATSTATVEFASAILLSSVNTGYFYNAAEGAMPIDATAPFVKYGSNSFYAWVGATADDNAPVISDGASVRADVDSQGIRFSATISADAVTALKALGTEITYGVVIAPVDFVVNAGAFTIEALQAYAEDKGFGETPAKVYANIQAVNSLKEAADGSVSFNGVIINVKAANYSRDFAAIAYACVDGTYYYSAFNAEDNIRNMAEIAAAALADVKDAADVEAGYIYEVNGKYSKYTADQCAALAKYCA